VFSVIATCGWLTRDFDSPMFSNLLRFAGFMILVDHYCAGVVLFVFGLSVAVTCGWLSRCLIIWLFSNLLRFVGFFVSIEHYYTGDD
jgi:hypothetical protein